MVLIMLCIQFLTFSHFIGKSCSPLKQGSLVTDTALFSFNQLWGADTTLKLVVLVQHAAVHV